MEVDPSIAVAISRKKALYGRFADTKQFHKFEQVALPDADFKFHDTDGSLLKAGPTAFHFSSRESFVTFFTKFFAMVQSLHMFGLGDFEQAGPDEVRAVFAMEDQVIVRGTAGLVEIRGGGYYHEVWQRKDGEWFLKSLDLRRTYQKVSLLAKILLLIAGLLGLRLG